MRTITLLFLLTLSLAACAGGPAGAPSPAPSPAPATPAVQPTAQPTSLPTVSATAAPTVTPAPSATPLPPTLTSPPTPTPDPWAAYEPYTIAGLRSRSYGGEGEIEIVRVLEERRDFTRYLFAYQGDGLRLTGMMNRPAGAGPFPVVILNHGYYPLDAYQTGNGTKTAADYLAARGFLTLSPDFRSHAGSDDAPNLFRAGHVIDTLHLIPMAQRLPDARPGKILMWGHSNGGAITSKVIAVSDQVAAALIYAPASSNIVEDYWFRVERSASRGSVIDPVDWPVRPEEAPDLYERLSPLGSAGLVTARVQIIWGTNDETVPRKWPEDLYNSLRDAGKQVEFVVYDGQPHSFNAAGNAAYLPAMVSFFEDALGTP